MRAFLSIALLCSCALGAHAQNTDSAKAKASAALALNHAQRERVINPPKATCDAKCQASIALAAAARERAEREGCMTDLGAAIAKSEKEKKPLFLWVGMTCDRAIRDAFKDAVHVHCDSLNDSKEPRLVVGPSKFVNWKLMKHELKPEIIPAIKRFIETPAPMKQQSHAPPVMMPAFTSASC